MAGTERLVLKHISGLPGKGEDEKVKVDLYEDRMEFNRKQIISLSRVKGCEIAIESRKAERHPIQMAIGIGFVSCVAAEWLTNFAGAPRMTIFLGIVGALIGAIVGSRTVYRSHVIMEVEYRNVNGEMSVIRLAEDNKYRKYIYNLANKINRATGYTPRTIMNDQSQGRYEI